ncbi:MAG TPA: alpha-amylase family protein [Phycisphaerae bacterium]|nr:alpha-amylase family protein [Phycisphaerae bacterium]
MNADNVTPATPESVFDKPLRWAQLTLVADDPGRFSVSFWLDYFRRTRVEGVCLSAGGCVAFYPTDVPLHYRSPWLGESDPFGELVAGCREMGMVVVARTDPHACHQDMFDAHPEWIHVDAEGNPRRHWSHPDYWVTCAFGGYNFEFMTEVTKEIVARYRVDGVFSNRWAGSGRCFCRHCQDSFRAATGMDLPRTDDPQDPARQGYHLWRQERLFELWRLWDAEIKKINPAGAFLPNSGGGAMSDLDMAYVGKAAPMMVADRQGRHGLVAPWAAGKNGKEYRAALGNKPAAGLFSVGLEEPYRWKDAVQAGAETRVWVADGIAQGLRPWYCKFSGFLHDERWLEPVEEIFTWHAANARYFRHEANLADIGVVYSQQTAHFYGGPAKWEKVEAHTLGVYQALVEARLPFEMVHDGLLEAPRLAGLKVLILPNIAALSDEQCRQLADFVAAGGSIVATHETSLHDERGRRRADFGLADLFGVSVAGEAEGPIKNAYLRLHHPHPVLAGLGDAPRIIHGVNRIPVTARAEFPEMPVTLIPSYPDLPMEEVYPRAEPDGAAELFLRQTAGGRVAYFNWDIDRSFWEILAPDHGTLLANTVRWALGAEPPATVTGLGMLDVAVWRQRDSVTVHMVNLTNPMTMKGPYRQIIPSPPQRVRLRLPAGAKVAGARLLVAGEPLQVRVADGFLEADIPPIAVHEVLAVDLRS